MNTTRNGYALSMIGMLLVLGMVMSCDVAVTSPIPAPIITPAPAPTPDPSAARAVLEPFCLAYYEQRWTDCKSLGTYKTKNTISMIANIYKNFTPEELVIAISQTPTTVQVASVVIKGSAEDRADGTLSLDFGTKKTTKIVHLVKASDKWYIDIDFPLW